MKSQPLAAPLDPHESKKRKRERLAIVLLLALFVALSIFEFRLTKVSTSLPLVNSIFFFGLLNINIILLVAVTWLIARNVGKLFFERRSRVLGASLKTKLVVAFTAFSVTPTLVLFVISSLYINSSFDKWFSIRVQNTLEGSLEITKAYYRNAELNSRHFAEHLATQIGKNFGNLRHEQVPSHLKTYLTQQREFLALTAIEYYPSPVASRILITHPNKSDTNVPKYYPRFALDTLNRAFSGERMTVIQQIGAGDLLRTLIPVTKENQNGRRALGIIVVNAYIPVSLVNKVDEISSVFEDYQGTNPLKYPIKTAYFVILVMITLVIIFVAIWLGIYIAKELTIPVEKLVKGVERVSMGDLNVEVERTGQDEISKLVDSFNTMTGHLRDNQKKLTQASRELETRTMQLEAVLANIGTGVLVVNRRGQITTFNRAAAQLLDLDPENVLGKKAGAVFSGNRRSVADLVERSLVGSYPEKTANEKREAEVIHFSIRTEDETKSFAGIATSLRDQNHIWGAVVVIDDMTHLIKSQREVAWREVARRIAHEIKNPLTPIKLSAQRLERQLGDIRGWEGKLLKECVETIVKHTDELRDMVNEFSNFARLPQVVTVLNELNGAIEECLRLFAQAHPQILFKVSLEKKMPLFEFDRDQVKRVFVNLLNNAVAAVLESKPKHDGVWVPKIEIASHYNDQLQLAVVVIADNGPGMPENVRSRVFEPYFSTKKEGTGLGLAIAKRIVNDHDGFIRVQSEVGKGTQFWIELPTRNRVSTVEDSMAGEHVSTDPHY